MVLYRWFPLANGLGTDHPVPNLPFVEDQHILSDVPSAIEAMGRERGEGLWGRADTIGDGWFAFTTDPSNRKLAWAVRWHPRHGKSITLYRNRDVDGVQDAQVNWGKAALLFRAGGYWWDGNVWYRPSVLWDGPSEHYYQRPVPGAVTVNAGDLLTGDPARARVLNVSEVKPSGLPVENWLDHLALWASRRDDGDLGDSVVTLTAPELEEDRLIDATEVAAMAGMDAATLRAYLASEHDEAPLPQATVHGDSKWARPVAADWAEQRRRSPDALRAAIADHEYTAYGIGAAQDQRSFTEAFFHELWGSPEMQGRWAGPHRNEAAVREVADSLGWVALDLGRRVLPAHYLAKNLRQSMLYELLVYQRPGQVPSSHITVSEAVEDQLDWLITHEPLVAAGTIHAIIRQAEQHGISREVVERTIFLCSKGDGTRYDFLRRVLSPDADLPWPDRNRSDGTPS